MALKDPLLLPFLLLLTACESVEPPVGAFDLIQANEIADCPEGEVFGGAAPHIFCMSPELFIRLQGIELYNYVYGGDSSPS